MSNIVQCPHCYSHDLKLVGCYAYSPTGTVYTEQSSFLDSNNPDVFESQKMLLCSSCNKHVALEEATTTNTTLEPVIRWETAVTGRAVPIICPVCKNQKLFIQDRVALFEQTYSVDFTPSGKLELREFLNDDSREVVTIRYRCALEDCTGVIQVNEDTFKVTPL